MALSARVRSSHVWRLAWPNIVSTLMLTSIGLAHIKIVAPYGADAVAAVSTGHRVYFLLQALLIGLSAATTAMVARHWGREDYQSAADAARVSLNLSVGLAIVCGLAFIALAKPIALGFGLEPQPALMATRFIQVMAIAYAVSLTLSSNVNRDSSQQ
jgi:Na+-driven multidrug efflux pump